MAETLLNSYPDYSKAPETYVLSIADVLSQLSDDVAVAVLDLKTGVRAKCSYLPTVADIVKCADEYIAARDRFKPAPRTGIHKLLPRPTEPEPTPEQRRRGIARWEKVKAEIVAKHSNKPAPMIVPENLNDEQAAEWVGQRLRTPAAPPSQELIDLVKFA
jgi:hypothetical protein